MPETYPSRSALLSRMLEVVGDAVRTNANMQAVGIGDPATSGCVMQRVLMTTAVSDPAALAALTPYLHYHEVRAIASANDRGDWDYLYFLVASLLAGETEEANEENQTLAA